MTENDILDLIKNDEWRMSILSTAEKLKLPDWLIGAGFVRSKVWNHLHGYEGSRADVTDIDLVYYDPNGNDQKADEELSERLKKETNIDWEIVNEFYAHKRNNLPPFTSTEDALSHWPETAAAIGVKMKDGELALVAPYGIADLVNLIVRPSPGFADVEEVKKRVEQKKWLKKWPKLKLEGL